MYQSTRGQVRGMTFEDALFSGYCADGGILVPAEIPTIDRETLRGWNALSYVELATNIVGMYAGDETPVDRIRGWNIYIYE